ncbi:MAG: hypothetical protein U1E38_05305 [Rhodospirillales bacterium]
MSSHTPVLVLEDDFLIALDLEEALKEQGVAEVCVVSDVDAALALLAGGTQFAAALLDVNVGARQSFGVAEVLRRNGLPFVFLTGYSENELPAELATAPVLRKPFSWDEIGEVVRRLGLGSAEP